MSIKSTIKKIPGIKALALKNSFNRQFSYDKNFFKNNYSHSKQTKNKLGYNILLVTHALEKGMSSKEPRRFGIQKTAELINLIHEYESYGPYKNDFAFINAINVLRGYVEFYKEKGWTDTDEYSNVLSFLDNYKNVQKMDVGSFTLRKIDFEKDSKIDYAKFLASRHSVREFKKKRIEESDLKKALEIAILSPSACNRQMCRVYHVSDNQKNAKVISMAQGFSGFEKDTINTLIITFDINANYFVGERNQGWFNAGLFSMNLVNAMHSLGIGSCFCQFGNSVKDEEYIKKILDIPKSERIATIIACGYYVDECKIPYSPRKELKDIYRKV